MALTEKKAFALAKQKAKTIKKRLFWLDALKRLHLRLERD